MNKDSIFSHHPYQRSKTSHNLAALKRVEQDNQSQQPNYPNTCYSPAKRFAFTNGVPGTDKELTRFEYFAAQGERRIYTEHKEEE